MPRTVSALGRTMSTSKAREDLSEVVSRAEFRGERTVLVRRGRSVAAIVSLADLTLLADLEDRMDLEAAREALKEPGTIPLDDLKRALDL